eukprot:scaffold133084_cov57-Phaeocystis_antarctica.AAC.1
MYSVRPHLECGGGASAGLSPCNRQGRKQGLLFARAHAAFQPHLWRWRATTTSSSATTSASAQARLTPTQKP